jgi:hypothetical protein
MESGAHIQVGIVIPVLDDWSAFATLVGDISRTFAGSEISFQVYAVDDGSSEVFDPASIKLPPEGCIASIDVLHLALNLGHQRAIAVGLSALAARTDLAGVVVMDGDGEDRPTDIRAFLATNRSRPEQIVLAERTHRSESRVFKFGYGIYRLVFRLLTGRRITFGNFSFIPMLAVSRLVHMPELWNNLAVSIIRSRLPYVAVPTTRGSRYAGRSHMGVVGLVAHGLSAMSVYTDLIFVRILLASMFVGALSVLAIAVVILIRFTTDLAIPGWATSAVGNLMIILMQTVVIVVATSLMMLAGRSLRPIIPCIDASLFVARQQRSVRDS